MPPPIRAAAEHGISYRPFAQEDLPFVAELYASTRRWEMALTGWPRETQEAFLSQQHAAQHQHYSTHYEGIERLIVERSGEAIGRLYLHEAGPDMRIVDISLVAQCRAQGIGGAILRDVIADAHARGKAVSIHVEKNNPARRLYLRLGFVQAVDRGVYDMLEAHPPQ
jgi:ribosomal protein S18 acetylase RimI-like enzyme